MNATPRWRGWLVAAAIFVLGVAAGAAGTVVIGVRMFRQSMQNPADGRGPADRAAARIGADLTETLQLTPEQASQVQQILNESAANLKAIRVHAGLQAAAELRDSSGRLLATLPPEKHAEFHRIISRRFERLGLQPPLPPATPP